jgi:hypothetical protein
MKIFTAVVNLSFSLKNIAAKLFKIMNHFILTLLFEIYSYAGHHPM